MGDRRHQKAALADVYRTLVRQARRPEFYRALAVPDTLDGRFDLLVLHLFLVQRRLRSGDRTVQRWLQQLMDVFATDMDRSLREMGVGDLSVGRNIYTMLGAVQGRMAVYGTALDQEVDAAAGALPDTGGQALEIALDNLYGTVTDVPPVALAAMAAYVRASEAALADLSDAAILAGALVFAEPRPPAPAGPPDPSEEGARVRQG